MSVYEALLLIDRGGVNHRVTGARAHYDVQPLDTVLVQRGDVTYRSVYKKPSLPEFTRRFTYTREYDAGEGKYLHPKGDGVINFGHDFGTAGNFPAEEWINVRNRDAVFNDLDGKLFDIKESTVAKEWDTVHITEEGGDFEAWYIIDRTDGWMKFKVQNVVNGRNNSNVGEIKGSQPSVDDGAILKMDFYREENVGWSNIDDDDLIAVWEDDQTKHIKGDLFKDLFPIAPAGSVSIAYNYGVDFLTDDQYKKATFGGVSKFFWIEADGSWRADTTKTGDVVILYAELSQHEGIAYWSENPSEFKFFKDASCHTDVRFLSWTNTTNLVQSYDFCKGVGLNRSVDWETEGEFFAITGLEYIDTTNWTTFNRLFHTMIQRHVDWSGAVHWNTSNVTQFTKMFHYGGTSAQLPVNLATAWDWTNATKASIFSCPKYGVPRWAEQIEWGPNLTDLSGSGGDCYIDEDLDFCQDGQGDLDLRGWCVTNITSRPNNFFVSTANVHNSIFNNMVYPLWGTCAEKIEDFTFPANKIIIDMRIHGDKSGEEGKDRGFYYEGIEDAYPVIDVSGQAYVLPKLASISSPFNAPVADCPDGYIFVGNPSNFEFGSNSNNNFNLEVTFTENCNTSQWVHTDGSKSIFGNFKNVIGGFEYIDVSNFTTLNYLFPNRVPAKIKNDHYEAAWPWEGCANWNTSKVTSMKYALKRCTPDIPKMNWDFTAVVDASYMFSTNYGTPKWVEDIQWGPNLTELRLFGNGFGSNQPSGGASVDNWWIGQERPLDLSKWDVRNFSSTPSGFMSTNPFEEYGAIATWTIEPNWGTTGS